MKVGSNSGWKPSIAEVTTIVMASTTWGAPGTAVSAI
jgi:hypothetical protein